MGVIDPALDRGLAEGLRNTAEPVIAEQADVSGDGVV